MVTAPDALVWAAPSPPPDGTAQLDDATIARIIAATTPLLTR